MYKRFELKHSLKNIPIPGKEEYKLKLIDKTRHFLRRMRLKAFFFEKEDQQQNEVSERYGFKSRFTPTVKNWKRRAKTADVTQP